LFLPTSLLNLLSISEFFAAEKDTLFWKFVDDVLESAPLATDKQEHDFALARGAVYFGPLQHDLLKVREHASFISEKNTAALCNCMEVAVVEVGPR
jgi:hypothetical protein